MKFKPPSKRSILAGIGLVLIGALIWFILGWNASRVEAPTERIEQMATIENTALVAISPLPFDVPVVLSALMERIIFCESSGNPNAYNKSSGASGLFQVIPSSERLCERGLNKELNMFNPDDNIECAIYLKEHGGLAHWTASKACWGVN